MSWLSIIVRMAGSAFALTAPLVQLQAEKDARAVQERLRRIEDPISALHPDVKEVSSEIYNTMREGNSKHIRWEEERYGRYSRALAVLEADGRISGSHSLQVRFAAGFWIKDPFYILYMAAFNEDPAKMNRLLQVVDNCPRGRWLRGDEIANDLALPRPIVRAVFDVFELKGIGVCSKQVGVDHYYAKA